MPRAARPGPHGAISLLLVTVGCCWRPRSDQPAAGHRGLLQTEDGVFKGARKYTYVAAIGAAKGEFEPWARPTARPGGRWLEL